MNNKMMRQEIVEAIQAGEHALSSLYAAREKLNSAKNWGLFDLLGGGFFSDLMKHSKMDDASRYMKEAKRDLQVFQRELKDVQVNANLNFEISGFLSFADFFFDGIFADFMMQSRINKGREQIDLAIEQTQRLLKELKRLNGYY